MNLPLPEGIRLSDVVLKDDGLEVAVRSNFLLGIPVRFKIQVQSVAGARLFLKVTPPVKPNWLVVRPLVSSLPGAKYAGHSIIEVDLVAMSNRFLSSANVKRVILNRSGLHIDASALKSPITWEEIKGKLNR